MNELIFKVLNIQRIVGSDILTEVLMVKCPPGKVKKVMLESVKKGFKQTRNGLIIICA